MKKKIDFITACRHAFGRVCPYRVWERPWHNHPMAPIEEMPTDVRSARKIHEAYRFAVANPEVADAVPCYCGCAGMGHASSYDCYVAGVDENGLMQFDDHATYCSICIDILRTRCACSMKEKPSRNLYPNRSRICPLWAAYCKT